MRHVGKCRQIVKRATIIAHSKNLVINVFTPDPKTLSLVVGIANLSFALLAWLYIINTRINSRAVQIWCWGRLIAGSGYLVNLASSISPNLIPPVCGNILQVLAAGFDIAAYTLLLELTRWHRPVRWLVASGIGLLLLVSTLSSDQHHRLLAFSFIGFTLYGLLACAMLSHSRKNWLRRLIGLVDAALALVLLIRVGNGVMYAPLERFNNDVLTIALYLVLYTNVIINGFGFLLLAKQRDDQSLARALDDLEEADNDRRQLLAIASHEFRTPVALIKASLDSLRFVKLETAPEISRRLENIRRASERLTELSNTLLTYDRLQQPNIKSIENGVDVAAVLQDALKLYPPEYGIVSKVPEVPCQADIDPIQVRIAIQNLVDNAIEHTANDGPGVSVSLTFVSGNVEIHVADHGKGIPDAEKSEVFDRFRNGNGDIVRGVGLSIVKQIAQEHGGDVLVNDNYPQGTVMILRLPEHQVSMAKTGC